MRSAPEMTTEKLQNLATCAIDSKEKVKILKLWNSPITNRKVKRFPPPGFSDAAFNAFLHKYVFWSQVRKAALELYASMMVDIETNSKGRKYSLSNYIEVNRVRQWDYAFNGPIAKKEITKAFDWTKQTHGEQAVKRLIYR